MVKYNIDETFDAISDPTRRALLDRLCAGEAAAGDLSDQFPVSRAAISKHLKVLRKAGLVHRRVEAQRRIYSISPAALAEVDRWLAPYRVFWSARLVDLKRHVESSCEEED